MSEQHNKYLSWNKAGVQVTLGASWLHEEQRLSIRSSTSSVLVFMVLLVKMSLFKYWALHPSWTGTSSLGTAALTFHPGFTQGSRLVSLSMRAKFLLVVDLKHLPTVLETILTSELLLFSSPWKKFTNLPVNCCLTVKKFLPRWPSTKKV